MSKVWYVVVMAVFVTLIGQSAVSAEEAPDSAATTGDVVVAYYLHGTQRCATCMKLEAYTEEAITTGFADQLADSSLVWRVLNVDEDANKHFVKDYGLYSQAVVLSRVVDGEEVAHKNLEKIWEKVNDKDDFLAYIRSETQAFLDNEGASD